MPTDTRAAAPRAAVPCFRVGPEFCVSEERGNNKSTRCVATETRGGSRHGERVPRTSAYARIVSRGRARGTRASLRRYSVRQKLALGNPAVSAVIVSAPTPVTRILAPRGLRRRVHHRYFSPSAAARRDVAHRPSSDVCASPPATALRFFYSRVSNDTRELWSRGKHNIASQHLSLVPLPRRPPATAHTSSTQYDTTSCPCGAVDACARAASVAPNVPRRCSSMLKRERVEGRGST